MYIYTYIDGYVSPYTRKAKLHPTLCNGLLLVFRYGRYNTEMCTLIYPDLSLFYHTFDFLFT